jgi:hypothetical protein
MKGSNDGSLHRSSRHDRSAVGLWRHQIKGSADQGTSSAIGILLNSRDIGGEAASLSGEPS